MTQKIFTCWQQLVASELLSDDESLQPCMKPGSDVIKEVCSAFADLCGAEQQLSDSYLRQDKLATALYLAMPLVSESSRRKLFFVLCSLVLVPRDSASKAALQSARNGENPYLGKTTAQFDPFLNATFSAEGSAGKAALQSAWNGENPYLGKSTAQISTELAKQLREESGPACHSLKDFVKKLGAETCWKQVEESSQATFIHLVEKLGPVTFWG
eukprot:gene2814-12569_t